jgi:hypothetical protein
MHACFRSHDGARCRRLSRGGKRPEGNADPTSTLHGTEHAATSAAPKADAALWSQGAMSHPILNNLSLALRPWGYGVSIRAAHCRGAWARFTRLGAQVASLLDATVSTPPTQSRGMRRATRHAPVLGVASRRSHLRSDVVQRGQRLRPEPCPRFPPRHRPRSVRFRPSPASRRRVRCRRHRPRPYPALHPRRSWRRLRRLPRWPIPQCSLRPPCPLPSLRRSTCRPSQAGRRCHSIHRPSLRCSTCRPSQAGRRCHSIHRPSLRRSTCRPSPTRRLYHWIDPQSPRCRPWPAQRPRARSSVLRFGSSRTVLA